MLTDGLYDPLSKPHGLEKMSEMDTGEDCTTPTHVADKFRVQVILNLLY